MDATLSPRATTLAIDVGTGSVRAAIVDDRGRIGAIESREHEQIVPRYGWSEQRPDDWWDGVVHVLRRLLARPDVEARDLEAVCVCGQMHATVLVDDHGRPTRPTAPLWNDKRTLAHVAAFEAAHAPDDYLADCANTPTPAWPGFKLQWLRDNDPDAVARASAVLMPKDYVNLRLTGERAIDWTEASCSFLMDPRTRDWSDAMLARLGLDRRLLSPIRQPGEILGAVTREAAAMTSLPEGLPVLVGGGDYPLALLGSGAWRPGLGSDVTGTSSIITSILDAPILHPEVSNVGVAGDAWGAFVLLESGGDAMRWARRALHENEVGYDEIVRLAESVTAGSDGLFFLPYLSGERLGRYRNSRAQFFGLTAGHGRSHLHRAVMEGVAFSVERHRRMMQAASGCVMERVIASSGGAKSSLWLRIKASVYGIPVMVPEEPECSVVGCAILAATARGRFRTLGDAVASCVRYGADILPDPVWAARYARMLPIFDAIYRDSQARYAELDALEAALREETT